MKCAFISGWFFHFHDFHIQRIFNVSKEVESDKFCWKSDNLWGAIEKRVPILSSQIVHYAYELGGGVQDPAGAGVHNPAGEPVHDPAGAVGQKENDSNSHDFGLVVLNEVHIIYMYIYFVSDLFFYIY